MANFSGWPFNFGRSRELLEVMGQPMPYTLT